MNLNDIKKVERSALQRAKRAKTSDDIVKLRSEVLGKKGELGLALRSLGQLEPAQRKEMGQLINKAKAKVESAISDANHRLDEKRKEKELAEGAYDVTLPGRRLLQGASHPLRLIEAEIVASLAPLGFSVADGPQIEHDWYNFEALNMPEDHPARDMQDTFFINPRVVLRTHTSNVQIRTMRKREPPVKILAPGMVFRHDDIDATHSPVFHQIEGLWIDEKATFSDLKGVLNKLAKDLFGEDTKVRFRPSFFPFTEPSAEVDAYTNVRGDWEWLEIGGSGMVDPAVLDAVGYDPEKYQGFAFGLGLERIAMVRWGIEDIRLFYENDQRFLHQFTKR